MIKVNFTTHDFPDADSRPELYRTPAATYIFSTPKTHAARANPTGSALRDAMCGIDDENWMLRTLQDIFGDTYKTVEVMGGRAGCWAGKGKRKAKAKILDT
jgi:hypothetical protein